MAEVISAQGARVHRPRNVDWKRAAALLYGDWGTSKAYVLGLAFVAAGFSSFPIIIAVCVLTAVEPCMSFEYHRSQDPLQRMPPPAFYDLTELQRHTNRLFGFSAQKTLDVARALYERHKLISYPRTDSRHR